MIFCEDFTKAVVQDICNGGCPKKIRIIDGTPLHTCRRLKEILLVKQIIYMKYIHCFTYWKNIITGGA